MMLNVLVNRVKRQYLKLPVFLVKGEVYTDVYREDKAKLLRVALNAVLARDSPSSFPHCPIAGYWYGDPVLMDIFAGGYVSMDYDDVTQDVLAALYNNGYRADLMSMVDRWVDPSDPDAAHATKLMKEGRYREVLFFMEQLGGRAEMEFFIEFAKLMIVMGNNDMGGSQ
jgi:hypothetical protein